MENRYTIGQELGRGTFGVTYKGYDNQLYKDVAIKIIDIEKSTQLGANETEIMNELNAVRILSGVSPYGTGCFPYIACYYDSAKILFDNRPSIMAVSEYIDGGSLQNYINTHRTQIKPIELWTMMEQMISALNHIHSMGFAHRDIKPDNIMIEKATGTLKIIDFGLACTTKCIAGPGTLNYIPPEVFNSKYINGLKEAQAHDIWSMGIVFYQLANLEYPFRVTDKNGNYLKTKDIQNNIVNEKLIPSHYTGSKIFFVSNDTFNYIIDSMLTRDWNKRPDSQSLFNYMIEENNGCTINNTKYNRRQILDYLAENNTVVSEPNAYLNSLCKAYFT